MIKYQLKAERVLPKLYRAAGNKLRCHLIILSDCDLQKRTQCVFVTMLGEEEFKLGILNFIIAVFVREAEETEHNPTHQSAEPLVYNQQSHLILPPTCPGASCNLCISHLKPESPQWVTHEPQV